MTAGTRAYPHHPQHQDSRPRSPPPHNNIVQRYLNHASAQWTNTEAIMVDALRAEYPQLHLTVVYAFDMDLLAYAQGGHAAAAPIDKERDRMTRRFFRPPPRRMLGGSGHLGDQIVLGKFLYEWRGKEYIYYRVQGHDGNADFGSTELQYILSATVEMTNDLLLEAGRWQSSLHDEVWVFDTGYWQKSRELYEAVQKASWHDVILDEDQKKAMINDVNTFFDSRERYEKLRVPWKRGVIYHGPPGNGKTISIKAMMHMLYSRREPIPTLYVRSLSSVGGPEYSIQQIFSRARREAPCYLVFEDLDSLVTDGVRSYFLNAVDGIERNDGILMVGSTNHLDRLDPGLAKRPSRFDRKYLFDNPNEEQRVAYMHFWQDKLRDNRDIDFPDKTCLAAAKITDGFSFAYMQEAMVAALLAIARHDSDGDDGDDSNENDPSAESQDQNQHSTLRTCLECMGQHSPPADGSTCNRNARRPFKGLYDWVWNVRQIDSEDPDLEHYILWRELKKEIRILREGLNDAKAQRN